MDKKYQDIHIYDGRKNKELFVLRGVCIKNIEFTEKNIIINYSYSYDDHFGLISLEETLKIGKEEMKYKALIID